MSEFTGARAVRIERFIGIMRPQSSPVDGLFVDVLYATYTVVIAVGKKKSS